MPQNTEVRLSGSCKAVKFDGDCMENLESGVTLFLGADYVTIHFTSNEGEKLYSAVFNAEILKALLSTINIGQGGYTNTEQTTF